jgi:phosphoglycolate phosphatase
MIKLMIFDFDGTLCETLHDLQDSINEALKINGYDRVYTYEEAKYLVGSGTRVLVTRALKPFTHTLEDEERVFKTFSERYALNQFNNTKPYPHIAEVLNEIKNMGIKIAVLSNKVEKNTKAITYKMFGENLFDEVVGQRVGVPLKPDPTSLNNLINEFGIAKEDVLYLGDSDVDMMVAGNAGIKKVAITYGFRPKETLEKYQPEFFASSAEEILTIVKNNRN